MIYQEILSQESVKDDVKRSLLMTSFKSVLLTSALVGSTFVIAGCSRVAVPANDVTSESKYYQKKMHNNKAVLLHKRVQQQAQMDSSHSPVYVQQSEMVMPAINGHKKESGEKYAPITVNEAINSSTTPVSTFSTDVDTASFANVRRFINQGLLPPVDAIRTEEIVNYFEYTYKKPTSNQAPVNLAYELATSPWNPKAKLLSVSLQAKNVERESGRNLVFLVDVSGSMSATDKLPLLKKSLHLLTPQLNKDDCIAIVAYAGNANVVLNSVAGNDKASIKRAIEGLRAGGSTNGGDGLELAYKIAQANFKKGGVNRVLLATDGDFNVGMSEPSNMKSFITKKRKTGVDLSVLGFGQGNYNDHLMEELSNAGNGNAAYIDSLQEAQKVLINQFNANFTTVAYDAKVQVEFNPKVVSSYRLLGYENRALADRDFKNDKKDAGDIGANQSVTALYEIVLNGSEEQTKLRYQKNKKQNLDKFAELGFIKIRYKLAHNKASKEYSLAIEQTKLLPLEQTSNSFKFAAVAAAYAEKLRHSENLEDYTWQQMISLANSAKGTDVYGYRSSFIQQLRLTQKLY